MRNSKIKNPVLILMLIAFFQFDSSAQYVREDTLRLKKNDFIIDCFYGGPYMDGQAGRNDIFLMGIPGTYRDLTNYNHFGAKVELRYNYFLGFGFEYTYALLTFKFEEVSYSLPHEVIYYPAKQEKNRLLGKMNIHFFSNDRIDFYSTLGAGIFATTLTTEDPERKSGKNRTFIPLALRASLGVRVYFTKTLGINLETGLGGPMVQAGITFNFRNQFKWPF